MKKLLIICLLISFSYQIKAQKATIFYLVRHAEKVTTDPSNKDPLLTEKGQKRALDLAEKLKNHKLFSIYCTDYQRIKLTAQPIADKQSIIPQIYSSKNLKTFAEKVLQENRGKKVLIVGHSNTVLETIEAFGGKRPIKTILENEYDYFFTMKISESGAVKVKFSHYGDKSVNTVNGENMN
jgi:broad specificity phosphatase PhoE